MAEIELQEKRAGVWPWVIGALLVLLVAIAVFALALRDDEPQIAGMDEGIDAPVAPYPAAGTKAADQEEQPEQLRSYLATCTAETGGEPAEMGREHEFTISCLERLGNTMPAVMADPQRGEADVQTRMEAFNTALRRLRESDPASTQHSNLVRDAAVAAAAVLESAQASDAGNVRSAAESIRPGTALLEQRDQVRAFFRASGESMQRMAQARRAS